MEIVFNTGSYSNRVTKQPTITTNEGPPNKFVRIYADVTASARLDSTYPMAIQPNKLVITQAVGRTKDNVKFTLRNTSDKDVIPKLVASDERYMAIELPRVVKAGKTAEGRVVLHGIGLETGWEKSFTIECDDETTTRFTVPIRRSIRTPGQDISKTDVSRVSGH